MMRLITMLLVSLGAASAAWAQGGGRASSFEFGGGVADMDGVRLGASRGSGLKIDSDVGFTMWGSYNFTNRLALGGEATWSNPSYLATIALEGGGTETIRAKLGVATLHVKGTFYLLDKPLTPFLEIGAGWSRIDSNIAQGPPITGCWWDPWWGYICSSYFRTYAETRTSYSGGIGLRWEITPELHLRASWERLGIDTRRNTENAYPDVIRVGAGWSF